MKISRPFDRLDEVSAVRQDFGQRSVVPFDLSWPCHGGSQDPPRISSS